MTLFKLSSDQEAEVLKRYEAGEKATSIVSDFSVCIATIYRTLEIHGVKRRPLWQARRGHTCNWRYFQTIDTAEKAYWLGFLAADGNVCKNTVTLTAARKDEDHVRAFISAIEGSHPIRREISNGFPQSVLHITSREMCEDLINLGITPRKSLTLQWPSIEDSLLRHFLRGSSDGDGSFSIRKRYNRICWQLAGSRDFLTGALSYLKATLGLLPPRITGSHPTWGRFEYGIPTEVKTIVNLLYGGGTVWLPRKKQIVASYFPEIFT